jgi:hypothetical protein
MQGIEKYASGGLCRTGVLGRIRIGPSDPQCICLWSQLPLQVELLSFFSAEVAVGPDDATLGLQKRMLSRARIEV